MTAYHRPPGQSPGRFIGPAVTNPRPPRVRGRGLVVVWLITTATGGLFIWLAYYMSARPYNCPGSDVQPSFLGLDRFATWHGGVASSVLPAFVLGALGWLAVGIIGWRLRRRLARLLFGFAGLYLAVLFVLWEVAPTLWGSRHCHPLTTAASAQGWTAVADAAVLIIAVFCLLAAPVLAGLLLRQIARLLRAPMRR